jgi:predicted amidohydrolase YtcJ
VVSEAPGALVLRRVEVDGRLVDVALAGGEVQAVAAELPVPPGAEVVDGGGGALLPGLHDHHVHLHAMAARSAGLDLDPLTDAGAVDDTLRGAVAEQVAGSGRGAWVRASGYDEHRHGPMDRARLDAVGGGRCAIRVQHRTGLSWVLSSGALAAVGLLDASGAARSVGRPPGVELDDDGRPTGWLHRMDAWLAVQLPVRAAVDLAAVGKQLAGYGITGVTDATVAIGADRLASLQSAAMAGALPQRLVLLGADDASEVEGWATLGPAKLLADEMVGVDVDGLTVAVARWHEAGRPVAIHAVTRAECVAAVSALVAARPRRGDRIEHGSVLPHQLDPVLRDGGITVVVQPSLVAERGDHHLAVVDRDDLPILHRHASLLAAGVRVGVGSDAPVTTADPWLGIAAASRRTTRGGAVVGASEAVDPATALGWYLADPADPGGAPRRIEPGRPADLCLLHVPLAEALAHPSVEHVRATWVGATLVHG